MALELQKMHTARAKQERIPEGTFIARISHVVDVGVQPQTDYQTGEPTASKPRVLVTWELPTETIKVEHEDGTEEDMPRLISKEYTLSNHEKSNLVKLTAILKPNLNSLTELLDVPCMVNVGSTKNGNAKVTGVVPCPSGMEVPPLTKEAMFFDFDAPKEDQYVLLPPWLRMKIKGAENYTGFADEWGAEEE